MFEWDEYNALEEANVTNGGRLVNVRRMFFFDKGITKLEDVIFLCFPSVMVLKLSTNFTSVPDLDLRGLKHLKSLELECSPYSPIRSKTLISIVGLGSLLKLGFLRWLNIPSDSPCIDEIGSLTNLQVLDLDKCGRLLDLSNLILLRVACFCHNDSITTITGFSSNHTNLQFLDLSSCEALRSCPGVGDLIALQELSLRACVKLKKVPNLQKLKRLRKLDESDCLLLRGLPGLEDLVSLLELRARMCRSLVELPDMCNLRNLRILDLGSCKLIKSLPGVNELVCLQSLKTRDCKNLIQLPDTHKLTNLQTLEWDPYRPLQSAVGLGNLISLRRLTVGINELCDGPDLCKLTQLETLQISGWQGQGFSSLAELVMLESVTVYNCKGVRVLLDLQRLSRLRMLEFQRCEFEDLSGSIKLTSLEQLNIEDCDKLELLPDLRELASLKHLRIKRCAQLRDLHGILGLPNLELLVANGHPWLHENLELDLPRLAGLHVLHVSDGGFKDLQGLAACSQLSCLDCSRCPIQELPYLANFPELFSQRAGLCELNEVDLHGAFKSGICDP